MLRRRYQSSCPVVPTLQPDFAQQPKLWQLNSPLDLNKTTSQFSMSNIVNKIFSLDQKSQIPNPSNPVSQHTRFYNQEKVEVTELPPYIVTLHEHNWKVNLVQNKHNLNLTQSLIHLLRLFSSFNFRSSLKLHLGGIGSLPNITIHIRN